MTARLPRIHHYLGLVPVIFVFISQGVNSQEDRKSLYDSSYAYLLVKNVKTGEEKSFCVNFQQWHTEQIAYEPSKADVLRLGWWGGTPNNTNVCLANGTVHHDGQAVALNYRLEREDGTCAIPFVSSNVSFKGAVQYEANQLQSQRVSAGILLVDRGRQFVSKWADYLFSEFYDPDLNTTLPIFFMYRNVFLDQLLALSRSSLIGEDLTLRFYRPPSSFWNLSMLILWLLAVSCVAIGGYWASHRKTLEENSDSDAQSINTSKNSVGKSNDEKITPPANCISIIIVMLVVVGVLMLGFYFRTIMVFIFNIILAVIGTFSIHRCVIALLGTFCRCGNCSVCLSLGDIMHVVFRTDYFTTGFCTRRPKVLSILVFIFSALLCILWFIYRRHPFAFILLDFINVTICLHILRGIRFPNLKWLTLLLLCMFAYDVFMVFGTPFLTKSGCSVMIEVAAGTDCAKSTKGYPVAPINAEIPEKFPMLFQVPHLGDPIISCIDLEVEKDFHPIILGLGDVIVPGYLISFCFTVDLAVRTQYLYGIVSVIGYGTGLIATFFALTIMERAQPALIYLIPFTLLPILFLSLLRHEFMFLWNGKLEETKDKIHDDQESVNHSRNGFDDIEAIGTPGLHQNRVQPCLS